jgi:hypothetical protein
MNRMSLWGIVGLLLAVSPGYGSLSGPRSLLDLEQSADLIVVATASGTFQAGSTGGFSLQVARVIKGDPSLAGSVVSVSIANGTPNALPTGGTITAAGSGLWFLQHSSSAWLLLPVVQGSAQLSTTFFPESVGPVLSAYAYSPATALSDKIAAEICSAIEGTNGGVLPFQFYGLQNGLLDQLNSPVVTLYYERMSTSTSAQQQILGLSGLIREGSGTALATAAQAAPAFEAYPLENGILLQSIRDYFRPADTSSIATLGQVAVDSTKPTTFREAVAHALAAIHSIQTLPYLATLLDDSDLHLQVEAIGGMGAFANGLPAQSAAGVPSLAYLQLPPSSPYRTADTLANFALGSHAIQQNEASYLSFWKQWWAQQRTSLGF